MCHAIVRTSPNWWENANVFLQQQRIFATVIMSFRPSLPNYNLHTYTLYPRRGNRGISDIPPRHPRFTKINKHWGTLQTGGKPIAVLLQSISGVSAINPLVAFYDIHGGKRDVLFFNFVPDATQDTNYNLSQALICS
jgi:hypothetical protein